MGTHNEDPPIRIIVFDAMLLASVALLLIAIHYLAPATLQRILTLHPDNKWYAFLTSAYVHHSDAHILGNIVGYAIATSYAYLLCLQANLRQWFRRTLCASLVLLPPLVSIASRAIFLTQYGQLPQNTLGFSSVAAGLGGFLLVALGANLATRYNRDLGWKVAIGTFLLLMLEIDIVYSGVFRPSVTGLVVAGWLLVGGSYVWEHDIGISDWQAVILDGVIGAIVIVVLSYIVFALFPAEIVNGDSMTNIFAHAIGFLFGGSLSVILLGFNYRIFQF